MASFALIGAAGYISPRHMKAIAETGNQLVAAFDPNDSVGIIDSYFPEADFFTEFERFDRHIDKLRRKNIGPDYISVASPNYLHDAHVRFSLRSEADAICEKPLVLNPWNIDGLAEIEQDTGKRIYNILQLRLHPSIIELRNKVKNAAPDKVFDVDLTYLTSRGHWYFTSWKGDEKKSGGIATNIGVHFFDMMGWIFGKSASSKVHIHRGDVACGLLEFEKARVRWFLSINAKYLPIEAKDAGKRTYRSIKIEDEELEFSNGFTDLHTLSYRKILSGHGYGLEDARAAIEVVHDIRTSKISSLQGEFHPLAKLVAD